jgi:hypothetical protein
MKLSICFEKLQLMLRRKFIATELQLLVCCAMESVIPNALLGTEMLASPLGISTVSVLN